MISLWVLLSSAADTIEILIGAMFFFCVQFYCAKVWVPMLRITITVDDQLIGWEGVGQEGER